VGPDQGNTWHRGAIRLTPSRLVAVAGSGRAPASAVTGPRRRARGRTDSGGPRCARAGATTVGFYSRYTRVVADSFPVEATGA
jgi:hypothetical protein